MTQKVQQDYLNLKEFTENASHEMQTPIAIAKGKLELLLENNHLSDEQGQLVLSAYNSLSKLSKFSVQQLVTSILACDHLFLPKNSQFWHIFIFLT